MPKNLLFGNVLESTQSYDGWVV